MIRINLLPVKRKRRTQPIPSYLIYAAILSIVTVVILAFYGFHLNSKVSDLEGQKAMKQAALTELKEKLKDVANFERDNEDFRRKSEIIEKLRKNQDVPLRLLGEASAMLPKGVWITSLTDKGGIVNVKGYAFSNANLVEYVQNLKGSKYLTDVNLLESRQTKVGELTSLYEFRLNLRVKV